MGRRPVPHKQLSINATPEDPRVRELTDDIAVTFLSEVRDHLRDLIDKGEVKKLTLKDLLWKLNDFLKAKRAPPTSIQMVQIPQAPQVQRETLREERLTERIEGSSDADRARLREKLRAHVDERG